MRLRMNGHDAVAPGLLVQEANRAAVLTGGTDTPMTTSVQSSTAVQDLARSLMQTFDKNGDSQLGSDEFNDFLGQLLGGIKTASGTLTADTGPQLQTLSRGGVENRHLFEGFNFDREQLVEKSAKDAFAMLAGKTGGVPATKAGAETWFNQNIKAGMEELGHKIDWVQGDKFQFSNWQGTWVVDFVRGADGPNPAFWWGADPAGASFT